jgi:hypothetical protein
MKKGAMFGLDARIALAIFGALSVISGAALYSAIEQSKVTSIIAQMDELEKSLAAFMLDTGQDLPIFASTTSNLEDLITSSIDGWKGPYSSLSPITGSEFAFGNVFENGDTVHMQQCKEPIGNVVSVSCGGCDGSNTCYNWLKMGSLSNELANKLDIAIDGQAGADSGKFRINWSDAGKTDTRIFYKMMPTLKQ